MGLTFKQPGQPKVDFAPAFTAELCNLPDRDPSAVETCIVLGIDDASIFAKLEVKKGVPSRIGLLGSDRTAVMMAVAMAGEHALMALIDLGEPAHQQMLRNAPAAGFALVIMCEGKSRMVRIPNRDFEPDLGELMAEVRPSDIDEMANFLRLLVGDGSIGYAAEAPGGGRSRSITVAVSSCRELVKARTPTRPHGEQELMDKGKTLH